MSRFQKNYKNLKYKIDNLSERSGHFFISNKEKRELQTLICNEFDDYKSSQIIEEYMLKDSFGNYLKSNDASRNFLNSKFINELNIGIDDILMNLESSDLRKIDIDQDKLSSYELNEIYTNGKQPEANCPVVYIFDSYLYCGEDKAAKLYIKINFDYNKDSKGQIQDCLNIKSVHLDNIRHIVKDKIIEETLIEAKAYEERNYDYINE